MGKYQVYESYEQTNSEFVKELPKGWVLSKFKYEVDYVEGPGILASDFLDVGVPLLRIQNVKDRFTSGDIKTYLEPQKVRDKWDHFRTKSGDLLISGSASTDLVTEVTEQYEDSVPYTGLIRLRAKKGRTDKGYVRYFVQSELFRTQIDNLKTGSTIQHFGPIHLQQIVYPATLVAEQQKIANFLDHETAKIDTLITNQEKLIELLKEKRQAVISHAVTKGLNPQAPMKDSGVEWLGEVPEHWDVKRNKHLLKFVTSGSRGWAEYYSDSGSLFFRIANLTRDTIEPKLSSIQFVTPPQGAEGQRSKIKLNDLLISITADLGSVCVADSSISEGFVSQHVSLCRPNSLVASARWLAYFVLSDASKEQLLGSGYGGTKVQLSLEDIRELVIAFPPQNEQCEIANFIDDKLSQFELLTEKAQSAIELMKERKTALISAAVTGKIDVRDWAVLDKDQG